MAANKSIEQFERTGVTQLGRVADIESCQSILRDVLANRTIGPEMFLTREQYNANPVQSKTNPGKGVQNLAEQYDTSAIDEAPVVKDFLTGLLGQNYEILLKKFVCGVPKEWIPRWLIEDLGDANNKNLNPYMKENYRDVTHFCGIDFHQDIIDWPSRDVDFITMYVYLDPVTSSAAPLVTIPNSFSLGADAFPHDLKLQPEGTWTYTVPAVGSIEQSAEVFTGDAGDVFAWHACSLHGTQPNVSGQPRLSLRYLIAAEAGEHTKLARLNASLPGARSLETTRRGQMYGNRVNNLDISDANENASSSSK